MNSNILIPKKIKVGFQEREDTYTKLLAYVIYHDGKVWRKENSWKGWINEYLSIEEFEQRKRLDFNKNVLANTQLYEKYINVPRPDHCGEIWNWENVQEAGSLEAFLSKRNLNNYDKYHFRIPGQSNNPKVVPVEYENISVEGFVLNKKVGDYSNGWNHRSTYCRVYDPRGFEFEITIENLLYVLENTSSIKGKGLEGKFIYGWQGTTLILIPEQAPEYKEMVAFTEIQSLKVATKDLVLGGVYLFKNNMKYTYMGRHEQYDYDGLLLGKKHWWHCSDNKSSWRNGFSTNEVATVSKFIENNAHYANLVDELEQRTDYVIRPNIFTPITESILKESFSQKSNLYAYVKKGNKYAKASIHDKGYYRYYQVNIGRNYNRYDSLNQLFTNHELWQLQTTN